MLALSIRQPFAELILRGIKTVEYRTRPTRIIGERFYIYASKGSGVGFGKLTAGRVQGSVKAADNIVVPREPLPAWMI
jgi:predicted transcriptional regulator